MKSTYVLYNKLYTTMKCFSHPNVIKIVNVNRLIISNTNIGISLDAR